MALGATPFSNNISGALGEIPAAERGNDGGGEWDPLSLRQLPLQETDA